MTADIAALTIGSLTTAVLFVLTHIVMRHPDFPEQPVTVFYATGIICGTIGALVIGFVGGNWTVLVGLMALFCPGGLLVIVLHWVRWYWGKRSVRSTVAAFWRQEIIASEHRETGND